MDAGDAARIAASSTDDTIERGPFGPVGGPANEFRFFHFSTVFWLIP